MRKRLLIFAIVSTFFALSAHAAVPTLEQLVSGYFSPARASDLKFFPGGGAYLRTENGGRDIVKYSPDGKTREVFFSLDNERLKEQLGARTIDRIEGYELSDDGTKILFYAHSEKVYRHSFRAHYYIYDFRRNFFHSLDDAAKVQSASFSPNGRMVTFVRDNDIYLIRIDFNYAQSRITHDGKAGRVINGLADWVYEEEFALTNAIVWAPDNTHFAFYRFDESSVASYAYDTYLNASPLGHLYPQTLSVKYPKAGEANASVKILTYNIATKATKEMLPEKAGVEYFPRIVFAPGTDRLMIYTLNRYQNELTLHLCSPRVGMGKVVFAEKSDSYFDERTYMETVFTSKAFYQMSDRDGYNHLYRYQIFGAPDGQLTKGKWEVMHLCAVDTLSGDVFFESTEASPLRRRLHHYSARKRTTTRLDKGEAMLSAQFSPDARHYLIGSESVSQVPRYEMRSLDGKTIVPIEENNALAQRVQGASLLPKEFFTFTTPQGDELNGWMIRPAGFDATRKYPVLQVQYSGPGSQEVLDKWSVGFEHYFADKGYLIVCVDGRGTGGRGRHFCKQTYKQLGVLEAQDQVAAARYLKTLPYVDAARIAIYGWSFGGYTTLLSMSLGEGTFKAGVAVAPVSDWRYYDTVYTERFLSTPTQNIDGYIGGSPLLMADKLQGELLLVHGTADENVQPQNTLVYADALVKAGKQFEMQLYVDRDHSIRTTPYRKHLYQRIERFLSANL